MVLLAFAEGGSSHLLKLGSRVLLDGDSSPPAVMLDLSGIASSEKDVQDQYNERQNSNHAIEACAVAE